MSQVFSTGQLAAEAGVHVETVRYYERVGLLAEPGRRPSGYRNYGAADLARLRSIVRLKEFGFTLKEIRQLLEESGEAGATCGDLQTRFREKRVELKREIAELESRCQTIDRALSLCDPTTGIDACPEVVSIKLGASTESASESRTDTEKGVEK